MASSPSDNRTGKKLVTKSATYIGDMLGTDMVDIFVGPELIHFKVHQKILCDTVPYFDKMLRGLFKEAIEQTVRLPEDDPGAFGLFLEWLYGGGVLRPADLSQYTPTSGPIFDRVKLYCFAEKICLTNLMDYTMTSLMVNYKKHEASPSTSAMCYMYQYSKPGSMLRKFCMECYIYIVLKNRASWTVDELADIMVSTEDFRVDYLRLTRSGESTRIVDDVVPTRKNPCRFHAHDSRAEFPLTEDVP